MNTDRFPLKAAARSAAKIWAAVAAIVTGLATAGIITADQGTALQGVLAGVATLVAAGTSALAAFGVRRHAEPHVTPVDDPRAVDGTPLAPIVDA